MAVNGLVVMTPASIVSAGTGSSSSINADGSVNFASCTSLSLNGVFTSSYDNYMMTIRSSGTATAATLNFYLRVGGTTATGANYTHQYLEANGVNLYATRGTTVFTYVGTVDSAQRNGHTAFIFGPYLTQPTAIRSMDACSFANAFFFDVVSTHSLSTSYDGLTLAVSTGSFSGLITIFGFNQ